jgi:hypothetical protein
VRAPPAVIKRASRALPWRRWWDDSDEAQLDIAAVQIIRCASTQARHAMMTAACTNSVQQCCGRGQSILNLAIFAHSRSGNVMLVPGEDIPYHARYVFLIAFEISWLTHGAMS